MQIMKLLRGRNFIKLKIVFLFILNQSIFRISSTMIIIHIIIEIIYIIEVAFGEINMVQYITNDQTMKCLL